MNALAPQEVILNYENVVICTPLFDIPFYPYLALNTVEIILNTFEIIQQFIKSVRYDEFVNRNVATLLKNKTRIESLRGSWDNERD